MFHMHNMVGRESHFAMAQRVAYSRIAYGISAANSVIAYCISHSRGP